MEQYKTEPKGEPAVRWMLSLSQQPSFIHNTDSPTAPWTTEESNTHIRGLGNETLEDRMKKMGLFSEEQRSCGDAW